MKNKCLLCKVNDVYDIKSHMTPAVITENTYGERGKELIHTIDAKKKSSDTYYGPGYPQTVSTEVKQAPNVRKGIFCKTCEKNFGNYETAAQGKLKEIVNGIGKGYPITKISSKLKVVDLDIHPNVAAVFFQSVIWRQCAEQLLDGNGSPLDPTELEKLRSTVLKNTSIGVNEIANEDLSANPPISIFTTYNTSDPLTASFANPHSLETDPVVFFVGPIVALYHKVNAVSPAFESKTQISSELLSPDLLLSKGKIAVIKERPWQKIHQVLAERVAELFVRNR